MPNLAEALPQYTGYVRLPRSLWVAGGLAAIAVLAGPHPVVGIAALAAVPLLVALSWRSFEVPVITFIAGYHWLQATMLLWVAAVSGTPIEELARFPGARMLEATVLTLLGVVVMILGTRAAWTNWPNPHPFAPGKIAGMRPERALLLYAILATFGVAADAMRLAAPAAWQLVTAIKQARIAFLFLLCLYCLQQRRHWVLLGSALAFDVITGFFSYFSEFKTAIFVVVLALLTTGVEGLTQRQKATIAATGVLLLTFAAFWGSIKADYRVFLNQGSGAQESVVSRGEQAAKLRELMRGQDLDLSQGLYWSVVRFGYVEFFGHVLNQVPWNIPHQDGRILVEAIQHVAVPRLLNPDKPPLVPDIVVTQTYTGLYLGGAGDTSISMGYMADAYIDFGRLGMYLAIFAWGVLLGGVYYWFNRTGDPLLAAAGMAVLLPVALLETTAIKQLGGLLSAALVVGGALYVFGDRLRRWLFRPEPR
ncbi:MAG: hypothetical protein ACRETF_04100 [Nevskiaceae bacterium]